MTTNIRNHLGWIIVALIIVTSNAGYSFDTDFSNVQEGVRMKIIGLGQDIPFLRIENTGEVTLAIRNDICLVISFWDGNESIKKSATGTGSV